MNEPMLRHETLTYRGSVAEPSFRYGDGFIHRRNLHLLWEDYIRPLNDVCLQMGGLNPFGEPKYRLVYGWECPKDYVGRKLELFHMQRWLPITDLCSEVEWDFNETIEAGRIPNYTKEPYPRHGDYFHLATCQDGASTGRPVFFRPWEEWVRFVIFDNLQAIARSKPTIAKQIEASTQAREKEEREKAARAGDQFHIRELAETMTTLLIGNPSLRRDPSLLLSPAVAYKRTKHAIRSNL